MSAKGMISMKNFSAARRRFLQACGAGLVLPWLDAQGFAQDKAGTAIAADSLPWSQWRGPKRDGRVGGDPWPDGLSPERLTELWRVERTGPSFSGPIVTDHFVFVTETRDEKTEHVSALDRATGKVVWEASWPGAMQVSWIGQSAGSWIRSTPACDGERLYVLGMRDVLVCLAVETGKEIWRIDFPKQYETKLPDFGGVSSPLLLGDAVFVQAGEGLAKVDKRTGKVLWRVLEKGPGKSRNGAFSSPLVATLGGAERILVQTREELAAVDPASGKVTWSVATPALFAMNILTPAAVGESVFSSNLSGTFLLAGSQQTVQDREVAAGTEIWRSPPIGHLASPIIHDGHAYLHLRNQRLACIELANGKRTWASEPLGEHISMVAQGDRILVLNDDGRLLLLRANPKEFDLLGEARAIADKKDWAWAHLAVAGRELYVRDLTGVTAFRWK
jgi:outer membrane protein assembly factor BamB